MPPNGALRTNEVINFTQRVLKLRSLKFITFLLWGTAVRSHTLALIASASLLVRHSQQTGTLVPVKIPWGFKIFDFKEVSNKQSLFGNQRFSGSVELPNWNISGSVTIPVGYLECPFVALAVEAGAPRVCDRTVVPQREKRSFSE